MPSTADALEAVEAARANFEKTLHGVADDFREHLARALDAIAELTLVKQQNITKQINPADYVALQVNLVQAAKSAVAAVEGKLSALDLDQLATKAQRNLTGETFIDYADILSPLLHVTGELVSSAGYSTASFASIRRHSKYEIGRITGIGLSAPIAARRLDDAIEKYGRAKIALSDAKAADSTARSHDDRDA